MNKWFKVLVLSIFAPIAFADTAKDIPTHPIGLTGYATYEGHSIVSFHLNYREDSIELLSNNAECAKISPINYWTKALSVENGVFVIFSTKETYSFNLMCYHLLKKEYNFIAHEQDCPASQCKKLLVKILGKENAFAVFVEPVL